MKIIECKTTSCLIKVLEIRKEVFHNQLNISLDCLIDSNDENAIHFAFENDNKIIGCARINIYETNAMLSKLAMLPEFQNMGYGSKMLNEIEEYCLQKQLNQIKLESSISTSNFYKKNGYTTFGDVFIKSDIVHITMKKNFSK